MHTIGQNRDKCTDPMSQFYRMKTWRATRDPTPNSPSRPETRAVNRLIGTWMPKFAPNTLTKNNNKTPITSFTDPCPIIFIGLTGAPMVRSKTITEIIMIMIKVELISYTPSTLKLVLQWDSCSDPVSRSSYIYALEIIIEVKGIERIPITLLWWYS